MILFKRWHLLFLLPVLLACNPHNKTGVKLIVKPFTANNDTIYLEQLSLTDSPGKNIDSVVIKGDPEDIVWTVPENGIYKLKSKKYSRGNFLVITDKPVINITAGFISAVYQVSGSPATTSLNKFTAGRIALADETRVISRKIDSLKTINASAVTQKAMTDTFNKTMFKYFNYAITYADTVKNPVGFMMVYNTIDFGPEREQLKRFINRAAYRFKNFTPIQDLKKEELQTIKIYEEEYNVGDKLPAITLPDQNGFSITSAPSGGKYLLIDFWSSWCQQCLPFKEAERALLEKMPGKISVISVAVDNQKADWLHMVNTNKYTWPQLIDENMWKGTAVRTLKFDSIPFNFLVDPQGKILAKALNAGNLEKAISANVK